MRTRETQEDNRLYFEALIRIGDAYLILMLRKPAQLLRFRDEEDAALPTIYPRLTSDDVYSFKTTRWTSLPRVSGRKHQKEGSRRTAITSCCSCSSKEPHR